MWAHLLERKLPVVVRQHEALVPRSIVEVVVIEVDAGALVNEPSVVVVGALPELLRHVPDTVRHVRVAQLNGGAQCGTGRGDGDRVERGGFVERACSVGRGGGRHGTAVGLAPVFLRRRRRADFLRSPCQSSGGAPREGIGMRHERDDLTRESFDFGRVEISRVG